MIDRESTVLPEPGFADDAERAAAMQRERDAVDRPDRAGGDRELGPKIVDDEEWLSLDLPTSRRAPGPDLVLHASPSLTPTCGDQPSH